MATRPLGNWGEALAAEELERRGWQVVARNFRAGRKEIDLVARRDGVVAFVEVKTRSDHRYGHPFESIDERKQRQVAGVAEAWLARYGDPAEVCRFDAVAVTARGGRGPAVEYLENAWCM